MNNDTITSDVTRAARKWMTYKKRCQRYDGPVGVKKVRILERTARKWVRKGLGQQYDRRCGVKKVLFIERKAQKWSVRKNMGRTSDQYLLRRSRRRVSIHAIQHVLGEESLSTVQPKPVTREKQRPAKEEENAPLNSSVASSDAQAGTELHSSENFASQLQFANAALQHVLQNEVSINRVFSAVNISKSNYRILVGYNNDFLKSGFDHIEEIRVYFSSDKITFTPNLMRKLGELFSPFPAFLYLPPYHKPAASTSIHNGSGVVWDFDEFLDNKHKDYEFDMKHLCIQNPTNACGRKLADSTEQPGKGSAVNRNSCMDGREKEKEGRKSDSESDNESNGSDRDGKRNSDMRKAEIPLDEEEPSPTLDFLVSASIQGGFQIITAKGSLKCSTEHKRGRRNAISQLEFMSLASSTSGSRRREVYEQMHTLVVVDSNDSRTTNLTVNRPSQTMSSNNKVKELTGSKDTNSFTTALNGVFSVTNSIPGGSLGGTFTYNHSFDETKSGERERILSQITPDTLDGRAWCHYEVDDASEKRRGLKMGVGDARLPCISLEYWGNLGEPSPPPPPTVDVRIGNYWQYAIEGWSMSLATLKRPSCFNVCLVVQMKMPTDLKKQTLYHAKLGMSVENPIDILRESEVGILPSVVQTGGRVRLTRERFIEDSQILRRIDCDRYRSTTTTTKTSTESVACKQGPQAPQPPPGAPGANTGQAHEDQLHTSKMTSTTTTSAKTIQIQRIPGPPSPPGPHTTKKDQAYKEQQHTSTRTSVTTTSARTTRIHGRPGPPSPPGPHMAKKNIPAHEDKENTSTKTTTTTTYAKTTRIQRRPGPPSPPGPHTVKKNIPANEDK